jgi:hypothetical protein
MMAKFIVKVQEVHTISVMVEAEDKQAAQSAAEEVVTNGVNQDGTDLNDESQYSYTLERDEWPVEAA